MMRAQLLQPKAGSFISCYFALFFSSSWFPQPLLSFPSSLWVNVSNIRNSCGQWPIGTQEIITMPYYLKSELLRDISNSLNKGVRVKSTVISMYPFGKVAPVTSRIVYAWRSTDISPCSPLNLFFTVIFITKPACFFLLPHRLQVDPYLLVLHIYVISIS